MFRSFTRILLSSFRKADDGAVALIFALAAIPMLAAAGAALDYIRAESMKTRLQTAIDSAALAAASAKTLDEDGRRALAHAVFLQNWRSKETEGVDARPVFTFNGTTVSGTAAADMNTTVMQLMGFDSLEIGAAVEINAGERRKAEIALVLDYSGSMEDVLGGSVKYEAMRDAAKSLVTGLSTAAPGDVKIGLVPFSHHVYTTMPKKYVAGQGLVGDWTGCTQDRIHNHNIKDTTPVLLDDSTKWGQPQAPEHIAQGCGPYEGLGLKVRPLSTDFTAINTQLDAMEPYAWTHIALGVEFGFHLLSPNAPYTEGVSYGTADTDKYMVVLTDGAQTEPGFGPGASRTVARAAANLEALCQAAKDKGVIMMTIAFDLDDNSTVQRLKDCATDPDKHFFDADDSSDMTAAFDQIKDQVIAMVHVSK